VTDDAEADDDEERVEAGQLCPERYAEMSAAEDLILTDHGKGARASCRPAMTIPCAGRGGMGVKAISPARAAAAGRLLPGGASDQIMLATSTGQSIRVPVEGISSARARRAASRCSTPARAKRWFRSPDRRSGRLHIIGGGMAGSEAAWQAANMGVPVVIHEMRPKVGTFAHRTGDFAEMVCSNSFRSDDDERNAVGLLHWEMRAAGGLIMEMAARIACPQAARWPWTAIPSPPP
jgi:hypothetical protein